jgi:hypothetical protein
MDILQVTRAASQDEQFAPALNAVQDELADVAPEQVEELISMLEFALQQPKAYPEIRAAAVRDDMVEPGDLPERFDAQVLMAVLVVLYKLRERPSPEQVAMRRGGLASMRTLASRGRLGDTMLAHISPEEAALLKARGGAGTVNPDTGLPQYFSLKKLFAAVLPIALNFVVPGLGAAIGTALGAAGTTAAVLGQAVIGGVTAGLTGGNVLQGAVLGGLGGGLGGAVGSSASEALGLGLGQTGQQVLGGALVGGAAGALTGQGFVKGALTGAAGAGLGQLAQGVGEGAVGAGIGAGGRMAGNMLTAGYSPKEALAGGALSGLAAGAMYRPAGPGLRPSQAAVESMRSAPAGGSADYSLSPATTIPANAEGITGSELRVPAQSPLAQASDLATQGVTSAGVPTGEGLKLPPGTQLPTSVGSARATAPSSPLKTLGQLATLSSLAGARPPAAQQAIQQLSPAQQEYFNRPSIQWDWSKMQNDANMRNMSLAQFMATYWPQVTSGAYNVPGAKSPATSAASPAAPAEQPVEQPPGGYARGGLGEVARLVRGGGTGRDDTVNARLSDGEYVMDAETVALLGDGSTQAGAKRLDEFRAQVRRHKGRALARGKFSPNAKSLAAYMKGM